MSKMIKILFVILNLVLFAVFITVHPRIILSPIYSIQTETNQNFLTAFQSSIHYWENFFDSHHFPIQSASELTVKIHTLIHAAKNEKIEINLITAPEFIYSFDIQDRSHAIYQFSVSIRGPYLDVLKFIQSMLNNPIIRFGDHIEIFTAKRGSHLVTITANFYILTRIQS